MKSTTLSALAILSALAGGDIPPFRFPKNPPRNPKRYGNLTFPARKAQGGVATITTTTKRDAKGNLYVLYTDGSWRRLHCEPSGKQKRKLPTDRGMARDIKMWNRADWFKAQVQPQSV